MTLFVQRMRGAGLAILLVFCAGCGWMGGPARPAWIDGDSAQYPASQFLVGVGQAESRPQATEQAYAAVSRIFKAEITAQAKDWESYLVVESRGQTSTERRLTLDNVTRVTTDKVLENVQILDTWFDQKARQYYALAGMNRAQAESAMVERLAELDRTIQTRSPKRVTPRTNSRECVISNEPPRIWCCARPTTPIFAPCARTVRGMRLPIEWPS
jgi:hypothetical protein